MSHNNKYHHPTVLIDFHDLKVLVQNTMFTGRERPGEPLPEAHQKAIIILAKAEGEHCELDEWGEGHRYRDDIDICRDCGFIDP